MHAFPLRAALLLAGTVGCLGTVWAQDAVVGPPIFAPGLPAPSVVPHFKRPPRVEYPDDLTAHETGYALARVMPAANGKWAFAVSATHVPFQRVVFSESTQWNLTPPPAGGPPPPPMWIPVLFNPATAHPKDHDTKPRLLAVTPVLVSPSFLKQIDSPGAVRVKVKVDATGKVTDVDLVRPGDGRLLTVLRLELAQWQFAPAREHDQPVAGELELSVLLSTDAPSRFRFYANKPPAAHESRPAQLTMKALGLCPPAVRESGIAPEAMAEFSVDVEGVVHDAKVVETSDPRLNEPALQALTAWRFTPALRDGVAVAQRKRLPVEFVTLPKPVAPAANAAPETYPKPIRQVSPQYPREMLQSGISGEVTVEFVVGTDGVVKNAAVVRSNNAAFDAPALAAVRQWRFEPGTRGGKPVETRLQVPISLQVDPGTAERRELLQASDPDPRDLRKLPPQYRYDTPPRFVQLVRPVYPFELQRQGITGRAAVSFVVGVRGEVALIEVREATRPEFGLALAAAIEASRFEPALRDGQPTQAIMRREQDFDFSRNNDLLLDRDERLLGWEKKKSDKIVSAAQLDLPLKPIVRRSPEFPLALAKKVPSGGAEIEFLVDEDGHPRLPRVATATEPEFGFAAAQAVATWAFEPPKARGKAVVVRVQQAFRFGPPSP